MTRDVDLEVIVVQWIVNAWNNPLGYLDRPSISAPAIFPVASDRA